MSLPTRPTLKSGGVGVTFGAQPSSSVRPHSEKCVRACPQPCVFKTVSLWERAQRPDCNGQQLKRARRLRL